MRIRLLVMIFISLYALKGSSQSREGMDVRVTVYDSLSHDRIPFANVALLSSTDTAVVCTDDSGHVTLHAPAGEYTVHASCVGYKTFRGKIRLDHSLKDYPIYMASDNAMLSEVSVVGRRKLVQVTPTGFLYDLKSDASVQSSNLLSALQHVPLVIIDPNDNITVKGSPRYSIFLNGHPYRIAMSNPKDVLQGIPASTVSKIEVITNVDGRYDADAGDAIINIITERRRLSGYTLSLNGGAATLPKANAGATFIGAKGNVDFSLGYNFYTEGQRHQPIEIDSRYTDRDESVTMTARGDGDWSTHTVRGLLTWSPDSLNSLYVDGHGLFKRTNLSTLWNQLSQSPGRPPLSTVFFNNNDSWSGTAETNVIYRHFLRGDKDKEDFSMGYRYTYNPDIRTYYQEYTDSLADGDGRYKRETRGGLNEHTVMVDRLIRLGGSHELRIGGKQVFRIGHTKASLSESDNGAWVDTDLGEDENMRYTQNISSLYTSYVGKIWNINIDASLRWEYTSLKMKLNGIDTDGRHGNVLLPHLGLGYRAGRNTQLSLSYSGGIQRADITMLNPFTAVFSSYMASKGNPDLRDTRTHTVDLGLMKSASDFFMSYGVSYQQVSDAIVPYSYNKEGSSLVVSSYENIDRTKVVGANAYVNYRPVPSLSLTATGNLNYCQMRSAAMGLNQHSWEYNLTFIGNISLKRQWNIGVQYGNYKNRPDVWEKREAFSIYSLSVSKTMLKNALHIRVVVNSPFNKYEPLRTSTQYPGYYRQQANYMVARSFGIDISYTLRSGKTRNIDRDRSLQSTDMETGIK